MSGISSSIGLISGINTTDLISKLIAIDSQPVTLVQNQVAKLQAQNTAFAQITATLLSFQNSINALTQTALFNTTTASSSNTNVLTATSSSTAQAGTYYFNVARLVSSQQLLTQGFGDTDSTAIGAGALTFESAAARLDSNTDLASLNGGAGVTRGKIRITDRSGAVAVVDLSKAVSVNDVLTAINDTGGINVTASVKGDQLVLTDNTNGAGTLKVENVGTTKTATSLGLTTDTDASDGSITGAIINYASTQTALALLNDGSGVDSSGGNDLTISDGTHSFTLDLSNAKTLGDVINAINNSTGNDNGAGGQLVTAALNDDRTGLKLSYSGGDPLTVSGTSATDLGLAVSGGTGDVVGRRLLAGLNSKLLYNLNGGAGAALGTFSITAKDGTAINNIDLSSAKSVSEVLDLINNAAGNDGKVTAGLNSAGNGLLLTDETGGTGALSISGGGAAALGLADGATTTGTGLNSGNLQLRYISAGTRLDNLNGGAGITRGKFTITDSAGASATVDLTQGDEITIGDVLREINSRGLQINARINDHGDGILIEDTGPGTTAIKVAESGSTTAASLGILGSASAAGQALDGSFEKKITLTGTETLQDVADAINAAGLNVQASILNDGSATNPYRLNLTSTKSGSAGAFSFDDGGLGFNSQVISQAQNTLVFYGSSDPAQAVALTSTTNTLTNVVKGVTIDLQGTSSSAVQLVVSQDDSAIVDGVTTAVKSFNSTIDALNKFDTYNSDTQQAGLLLGDSTVLQIRSAIYRLINTHSSELTSQFTSFSQLGIKIGSDAKLDFDSGKLTTALQTDRSAVQQFFTFKQTTTDDVTGKISVTAAGPGVRLYNLLDGITNSTNGTLTNRTNTINKQIDLDNQRIDELNVLLAAKKARYQSQFNAMEQALADLQSQSTAIGNITSLLSSNSSSSKSSSSSG